MRAFFKDVFRVSFSNAVSLLSGVIVSFLIPKMMGLVGYANYKIFTIYLNYLPLLSLGLGDGLYLKYSGISKEELDCNLIRYYLRKYYIQLICFFSIMIIATLLIVPEGSKFICVALAFTILTSQITAVHQNLSVLTSRFNEYSTRVISKSIALAAFVLLLYAIYLIKGCEISYQTYVIGLIIVEMALSAWYVITYKEFNFGGNEIKPSEDQSYRKILMLGFPLLVSNMAGSIFLNLDRQFVSILFCKEDYAIYAFAYNMLTLISTITSAVSLIIFPQLKKHSIRIDNSLSRFMGIFSIFLSFCLISYYPLCWVVARFLPNYIGSLEVFRIVLPGLVLSSAVTVIVANFYKLEGEVKRFFWITISAIVLSIVLNYAAYRIFGTYQSISWVSLLALLYWYGVSMAFFIRKYRIRFWKNLCYVLTSGICFLLISSFVKGTITGMALWFVVFLGVAAAFYHHEFREYISRYRKNADKSRNV